jgi:streptogrisin C
VLTAGDAAVRAALQRDLDLTADELDDLLATLSGVEDRAHAARSVLGDSYGGSWFDHDRGELVVGVTSPGPAFMARATGARTQLVQRSYRELEAITDALDNLQRTAPVTMADAYAWSIDVHTNRVQLAVAAGRAEEFAGRFRAYGDAIVIEEWPHRPVTTNAFWIDAGLDYNNCSTGFNVASATETYYLTAGHCGEAGVSAFRNGFHIGTYVASFFPGEDDALVEVLNTEAWTPQGPFIYTYPGLVFVDGMSDAPVGTPVCTSGRTTGLTCGIIRAKNESVNFPGGFVHYLTRHTACIEPGDSGGPAWSTVGGNFAEGIHSGAVLFNGQCGHKVDRQNMSWYFPVSNSLAYYGSQYGVTLMSF